MFFGSCFGNGSVYPCATDAAGRCHSPIGSAGTPRPAPRAPIVAERLWAGAAQKPAAVLEAVGCAWWYVPPPPPPSPPPTPGGTFSATKGGCRDSEGRDPAARLDHSGPVNFTDCRAKCAQLGERCDAYDVEGGEGCLPSGVCGWCGVWGNITAADTDGMFLYYQGPGARACKGVQDPAGAHNTCYRRPPFCTSHGEGV